MFSKITNIFLFILLVQLVGCSSTVDWPQLTGFLDSYAGMYRSSEVEGIFVIKHKAISVNDYSKFLVDPVTIQLTPDAKAYTMERKDLERIASVFRSDIKRALQKNYSVVENPGAGVLRVRVAVTDILERSSSGSSKGLVEAEFIDTQSKERIAAVVTSTEGMLLDEWASLLKGRLDYLNSDLKIYQVK
jgi:hypothetical protein